MTRGGLPHSEIPGSKLICSSPGLIAACHVLHRLLAPRHSPYTLSSLTIRNSKLTLPDRLHTIERATVPCNTACVVVGKNYRLQNIQLSKIRWGPSPQAPGSLACGDPKAPRRSLAGSVTPARSLAGPFAPLRSLAGSLRNALRRESDYVGPAIGAPRLPICCPLRDGGVALQRARSGPTSARKETREPHSASPKLFPPSPFGLRRGRHVTALPFQRTCLPKP